jgi:hypothetical protein
LLSTKRGAPRSFDFKERGVPFSFSADRAEQDTALEAILAYGAKGARTS